MDSDRVRMKAFAVSAVLSVIAGGGFLAWMFASRAAREPGPLVVVVDTTKGLFPILKRRNAERGELEVADASWPPALVREPLDEALTALFYPQIKNKEFLYDPQVYFRRRGSREYFRRFEEHPGGGWTLRTNSLGMREDEDVLAEKPDVRILVAGDSHTGGVIATPKSFTNVLEAALAAKRPGETIEALNCGAGGYNFYNYLGTLELYEYLAPDVFLFVVFGGNDFAGCMLMQRFFHRRRPPRLAPYEQRAIQEQFGEQFGSDGEIVAQELSQLTYFLNNPGDEQVAIALAASITAEIEARCAKAGIRLICAYIPPPLRGQPEVYAERAERLLAAWDLTPEALALSDRLADGWLAFLGQRGIPFLDTRPLFRAATEPLYWKSNSHIDIAANRMIGEALVPIVESVLE